MQKKRKYQPKNKQNVKKNDIETDELLGWLVFTAIYIFLIMYLAGMAKVYYPNPMHLGLGQYIDPGTGVFYGGIAIYSIITVIIFKKIL